MSEASSPLPTRKLGAILGSTASNNFCTKLSPGSSAGEDMIKACTGRMPSDTKRAATNPPRLCPSKISGVFRSMRARVLSTISARSSSKRLSVGRPPRGPPDSPWPYWS